MIDIKNNLNIHHAKKKDNSTMYILVFESFRQRITNSVNPKKRGERWAHFMGIDDVHFGNCKNFQFVEEQENVTNI